MVYMQGQSSGRGRPQGVSSLSLALMMHNSDKATGALGSYMVGSRHENYQSRRNINKTKYKYMFGVGPSGENTFQKSNIKKANIQIGKQIWEIE